MLQHKMQCLQIVKKLTGCRSTRRSSQIVIFVNYIYIYIE